jgi:uncharacterized membrane protein
MSPDRDLPPPEQVQLPARTGVVARVRNYFLTGLVIAAPLAITLYIIWWLVHSIDSLVKPLIPARYDPDLLLPFSVPGVGVVIAFVLITLLGFLTANLLGRTLISYGERILGRMPFVRTIYGALKQIFETMLSSRASTFNQVVLIEYPRRDLWSIAFVATSAKGEVREKLGQSETPDDEIMSVFVPTTPNPTSGYLLFCKRSEMIPLDMSIEEAAKLVISAGLVTPDYRERAKALADVARKKARIGAAE